MKLFTVFMDNELYFECMNEVLEFGGDDALREVRLFLGNVWAVEELSIETEAFIYRRMVPECISLSTLRYGVNERLQESPDLILGFSPAEFPSNEPGDIVLPELIIYDLRRPDLKKAVLLKAVDKYIEELERMI